MNEVDMLAAALKRQYSNVRREEAYGWRNPALDAMDAVLSLNRHYDNFVMPRLELFRDRRPEVNSLARLSPSKSSMKTMPQQ